MEATNFPAFRFAGQTSLEGPKCSFRGLESLNLGSRGYRRKFMNCKFSRRVCCALAKSSGKTTTAPMGHKNEYQDNWIENMAINHLSKCVQQETGKTTNADGYEGLVDTVSKTFQSFNPIQQRDLIIHALHLAVPEILLRFGRAILQPSKSTNEFCAASTPFLFGWLVGPSEVRHTEIDGIRQKSMVYIKKCRLLASTSCVGICTNLCKIPSQQFIAQQIGTPATLTPNFEDMSCEMVFGKKPPPIEEDPAFSQPCYKLCSLKQKHTEKCSNVQKDSFATKTFVEIGCKN